MKIKRGMQEHIDNIDNELRSYCAKEMLPYTPIKNTDKDYAEGHITFSGYKVHIRCHDSGGCYSFMEKPILDNEDLPFSGNDAAVEMIFEFSFSPLLFNAYDIHNVVEDKAFETLAFNFIGDAQSAKYAVEKMMGFLKRNYSAIQGIVENKALQDKLAENYIHDYKAVYGEYDTEYMYDDDYIEDSIDDHLVSRNFAFNDELISFLVHGNSKRLKKALEKAESKNELIVFEKRFKDFLEERNYEKFEESASKQLATQKKKYFSVKVIYGIGTLICAALGLLFMTIAKELIVKAIYPDDIYLGNTLPIDLVLIPFAVSVGLLLCVIIKKIPLIKDKVGQNVSKDKYDGLFLIIAVVCLCGGLIFTYFGINNNSIRIHENEILIDNTPMVENELTFIYIKGYQYEFDTEDSLSYSDDIEDRQLYYVWNNDYEGYIMCDLLSTDSIVTNDVLKKLKQTGVNMEEYKHIEAFANKYGFEITE